MFIEVPWRCPQRLWREFGAVDNAAEDDGPALNTEEFAAPRAFPVSRWSLSGCYVDGQRKGNTCVRPKCDYLSPRRTDGVQPPRIFSVLFVLFLSVPLAVLQGCREEETKAICK